jgi:hypothetical protein
LKSFAEITPSMRLIAAEKNSIELNRFLQQHALQNQRSGGAQTYVALGDQNVAGYYALAVGSVAQEDSPERVKKGLAKHSIPIMILARLAVDRHWQKR